MKLHLLNTSIIPSAPGAYTVEAYEVDLPAAQAILAHASKVVSHIGHESTAQVMSTLLKRHIPMDRTPLNICPDEERNPNPPDGDGCLIARWPIVALVFQLRGRPPEGTILTAAQIEDYGYDLRLLVYRRTSNVSLRVGYHGLVKLPYAWEAGHDRWLTREDELIDHCFYGTLGLDRQGRLAMAVQGSDGPCGSTTIAKAL